MMVELPRRELVGAARFRAAVTMKPWSRRSRARRRGAWARLAVGVTAVAAVVALAGCSSSKPAYCADRANLQDSVKGLTSLNVSSGVSGLKSQVDKIQSSASAVVSSAKGDFPSQTSAITSSVDALKSSVTALGSSPSAAQIATVTKDASNVVSSVKTFIDDSNSKCS